MVRIVLKISPQRYGFFKLLAAGSELLAFFAVDLKPKCRVFGYTGNFNEVSAEPLC